MNLILASKSPRRRELLQMLGLTPKILVPEVCEDGDRSAFTPEELVMGLASRKARATADILRLHGDIPADTVILAADTVVVCDGKILEKPTDKADAARMLRLLSGRAHEVFTGVAVVIGDPCENGSLSVDVQRTAVYFRELTDTMIASYVASNAPMDKAGAYGIQERGGLFVERIDGDYYNVVGLPLVRVDEMLRAALGHSLCESSNQ
ncbi:MAG: septum formation protein Maf [Clostridia bacterium]|nr:septum formation protein Maf [Clostridia bacterium]